MASNGTLSVANSDAIGCLAGSGSVIISPPSILSTGNDNEWTIFTGVISDGPGGGLTKNGTGNFILTGVENYTGLTTINGGTLTFEGDTSQLPGNMVDDADLVFAQSANSIFNGTISGTGNVTQSGTANFTLAGANTYSGNTTINTGTLTLTGDTSGLGGNIVDNSTRVRPKRQ